MIRITEGPFKGKEIDVLARIKRSGREFAETQFRRGQRFLFTWPPRIFGDDHLTSFNSIYYTAANDRLKELGVAA